MNNPKELAIQIDRAVKLFSDQIDKSVETAQSHHPGDGAMQIFYGIRNPEISRNGHRGCAHVEALLELPGAIEAMKHITQYSRDFIIGLIEEEEGFADILEAIEVMPKPGN